MFGKQVKNKIVYLTQTVICLIGLYVTADAQQALWANYHFSNLSINPALTGERGYLGVTGLIGNQFTGSVRPQAVSQIVVADSPLQNAPAHNLGFQGFNSRLGNINNIGLNLTYAYRYIGEGYKLSIGADAGFMVQPNTLANNAISLLSPFAGFGLAGSTDKAFFSVSNPLFFFDESRLIGGKKPWFLMGGTSLGNPEKVLLNLSTLIEINTEGQNGNGGDLNAKLWLGGRAGLGISYRTSGVQGFEDLSQKVVYSLEYQFSTSIRLGVSFDDNPLQGIQFNQFGGSGQAPAVFQVAINYRALPKNIPMARFDYY